MKNIFNKHKENKEITREIEKSLTDIYKGNFFIVNFSKKNKDRALKEFVNFIRGKTEEIDKNLVDPIIIEIESLKYGYFNYCIVGDYLIKLIRAEKSRRTLIQAGRIKYTYLVHSIYKFKQANISKLRVLGVSNIPEYIRDLVINNKVKQVYGRW